MSASVFVSATPPLPRPPLVRSRLVSALAWILIVVSALLLPISLITLLMFIAGSDGTANASLLDALNVIARPPATFLAGIGLLLRWRWARAYILALAASFVLWSAVAIARGPSPQRSYTSPGGTPTTVMASSVNYPLHLTSIAISLGVFFTLRHRSVRREFRLNDHSCPRPNTSPVNRRAVIPPHVPAFTPGIRAIPATTLAQTNRSQRRALLAAIFALVIVAIAMGWIVQRGLFTGETISPARRATQNRSVSRAQEPLFFWVCLGLYSAVGVGSLGLASWGIRESSRVTRAVRR